MKQIFTMPTIKLYAFRKEIIYTQTASSYTTLTQKLSEQGVTGANIKIDTGFKENAEKLSNILEMQ